MNCKSKSFLHLGLCDKLSDSILVEWRNTKGDSIKIDISEGKQCGAIVCPIDDLS